VKATKTKDKEVKIFVHHSQGIGNWEAVVDLVFEEILCNPDLLSPVCGPCHDGLHPKKEKEVNG
jgi:hypothetical protein